MDKTRYCFEFVSKGKDSSYLLNQKGKKEYADARIAHDEALKSFAKLQKKDGKIEFETIMVDGMFGNSKHSIIAIFPNGHKVSVNVHFRVFPKKL